MGGMDELAVADINTGVSNVAAALGGKEDDVSGGQLGGRHGSSGIGEACRSAVYRIAVMLIAVVDKTRAVKA